MDTVLPLPVAFAFILGLLPYFILHRATRWALRRKLHQAERQITEFKALVTPAESETSSTLGTIPPSAAPIAVPPGVS